MSTETVHPHPSLLSSTVGVGIAVGVIGLLAQDAPVFPYISLHLLGLAILAGAVVVLLRHDYRFLGTIGVTSGILLALLPAGLLVIHGHHEYVLLVAIPGMIGALVMAIGLLPVHRAGSRLLLKAGTGIIFLAVLAAGVVQVPTRPILLAGIGTIVAWDAGEQAINIGEQLGSNARTASIELIHVGATLAVGGIGLALVVLLGRTSPSDLSLVQFVAVLGVLVLLTLALHE